VKGTEKNLPDLNPLCSGPGDIKMGALAAMNDTFRFLQKRYTDLAIPALEGYLIMMVTQFVSIPLIIILMFPALLIPATGSAGAIAVFVVVIILLYMVVFVVGMFSTGIMLGGMVGVVDDVRNHRKIKFGDLFKYGWSHKWELFSIQLVNSLLISLVVVGILGIAIGLGIVILMSNAMAGLIFIVMMTFLVVPITYALMPIQYLPYVIRLKRGAPGVANVSLAWKEYFSDPVTYGVIGLMYMILILLLMFIPFISIIVMLALHPAFLATLLIYYDEKYRIPVMPEPPAFPQYPPYQPYPNFYQAPPPNYYTDQFPDRYWR